MMFKPTLPRRSMTLRRRTMATPSGSSVRLPRRLPRRLPSNEDLRSSMTLGGPSCSPRRLPLRLLGPECNEFLRAMGTSRLPRAPSGVVTFPPTASQSLSKIVTDPRRMTGIASLALPVKDMLELRLRGKAKLPLWLPTGVTIWRLPLRLLFSLAEHAAVEFLRLKLRRSFGSKRLPLLFFSGSNCESTCGSADPLEDLRELRWLAVSDIAAWRFCMSKTPGSSQSTFESRRDGRRDALKSTRSVTKSTILPSSSSPSATFFGFLASSAGTEEGRREEFREGF
mmetsp:Transcript_35915/g.65973  ORF Transcript_35915/g.65973 Transcript_35915/m.65973 type:complete len:283 (-) Transcript_35915:158-1006(-)